MTIIQSSGTGKSRLLDELSKVFLTTSFTLRHLSNDISWPPGDHEILTFLTGSTDYKELIARAMSLLSATLNRRNEFPLIRSNGYCDKLTVYILVMELDMESFYQKMKIAKEFHDTMAPRDQDESNKTSQGLAKEETNCDLNFRSTL